MFRRLFFVVLGALACFQLSLAQVSRNVSLFGQLVPNPLRYSGSWYYAAPNGQEYGLVGGYNGTHVIAVDDSADIHQAGFVAGPASNWRELTVVGNHAFVVTEGSGAGTGMQVISLAPLPDSVHLVTTYQTTFTRGHIIMRDVSSDSPYVYISGTSTTGGVHILDVSTPSAPIQIGLYDPAYYIHDAHIRGNRLYASAGGMRRVDVVDISDKRNPILITHIPYQGSYTHSCWTTDDHRFLFVTDEQDGQVARIWNIENLNAIHEVSQYSANLQSLVHNPYIRSRYAFIAHNTEGIRVVDIADPSVPVEVGYYDTFTGPSGGFNGLWSACPYLPSGKILGGDRVGGLYIWRFNNARAGRLYGSVRDSLNGLPIDSAMVAIIETGRAARSDSAGEFKIGELPGVYTITVAAAGYHMRIFNNVALSGGDSISFPAVLSSSVSSVGEEVRHPQSIVLLQNYPNPFNPTTHFGFRIVEFGFVSLKVYDILGREVRTLVNEDLQAGAYETTFSAEGGSASGGDASALTSGVYFYRLSVGSVAMSKRMILVR